MFVHQTKMHMIMCICKYVCTHIYISTRVAWLAHAVITDESSNNSSNIKTFASQRTTICKRKNYFLHKFPYFTHKYIHVYTIIFMFINMCFVFLLNFL